MGRLISHIELTHVYMLWLDHIASAYIAIFSRPMSLHIEVEMVVYRPPTCIGPIATAAHPTSVATSLRQDTLAHTGQSLRN